MHDGEVDGVGGPETESNVFDATVYRTTPATVPVFAVLAGLLGAAMTYLLIGWLNRRTGRLARAPADGHGRIRADRALAAPAAVVCGAGLWTALRGHTDIPIRTGADSSPATCGSRRWRPRLCVLTIAGVALARPTRTTEVTQ